MCTYSSRFTQIARRRRRLGLLGRSNRGQRFLANGFTLSRGDIRFIGKILFQWLLLELKEGWHSWRQPREREATLRQSVPSN
jgi:hypothetical protein